MTYWSFLKNSQILDAMILSCFWFNNFALGVNSFIFFELWVNKGGGGLAVERKEGRTILLQFLRFPFHYCGKKKQLMNSENILHAISVSWDFSSNLTNLFPPELVLTLNYFTDNQSLLKEIRLLKLAVMSGLVFVY